MKNELAKGHDNIFKDIVKKPVYHSNHTSNEKYIPSEKKIRSLEIAYKKKMNEKNKKGIYLLGLKSA